MRHDGLRTTVNHTGPQPVPLIVHATSPPAEFEPHKPGSTRQAIPELGDEDTRRAARHLDEQVG